MQATEHFHDHEHEHPHSTPLREWLKTALLLALGLYFVYIILTGNLTNYINVRFAWLSYVAAVIFLLLGAASAYKLLQARQHHHHHDHEHDHDHSPISWVVLAVVAVPLVLGTLIPSRPLGAAAVEGDLTTSSLGGDSATAFSLPPEQRNILDWVRAFNSTDDPTVFNGQAVDVVGFVYHGANYPDDTFLVARFTISCCVADSLAIGLPVTWAEPLPQDTWVRVRGQLATGTLLGEERAIVQPTSVEVIPQPEHPYLYP